MCECVCVYMSVVQGCVGDCSASNIMLNSMCKTAQVDVHKVNKGENEREHERMCESECENSL